MDALRMTDARTVVERYNSAWRAADLPALIDCLAEDVVFCATAWSGPAVIVRGREAVVAEWKDDLGDDPELSIGTMLRGIDVYTVADGLITVKDVYSKVVRAA